MGVLKKLFVILIILIIALFGLIIFSGYLSGDLEYYYPELVNPPNENPPDNSSNNTNNSGIPTNNSGGNIDNPSSGFEDNAYFYVSYPAPLSINKSPIGGYSAIELVYESFSILISYDNSEGVSADDYVGPYGKTLDKEESDFELSSEEPVIVDGVPGYELFFLPIYEDIDYIGVEGFAIKGGALLYYQELIFIDDYDSAKTKADSIVSTIKIK